MAKKLNLDLVEVSPNTNPPICKIINYGKFIYKKNKTIKIQRKKLKLLEIKEIKFRPNTNLNDYNIKIKKIKCLLKKKKKVKIILKFRGREIIHKHLSIKIFDQIKKDLNKIANIEYFSKSTENHQIIMIITHKNT